MSVYIFLDGEIIEACQQFIAKSLDIRASSKLFDSFATKVTSLEDKRLRNLLESVTSTFDIFWYAMAMDIEETQAGYDEIRKEMIPYIEKIEKLIIRGKEEGEPITDNERIEWWKMQKKREREEFYKMNGYYEDDNIKI